MITYIIIKKNKKLLILFLKSSISLVLYVLYIPANLCIPKPSLRLSNAIPTKKFTLSFAQKIKGIARKNETSHSYENFQYIKLIQSET